MGDDDDWQGRENVKCEVDNDDTEMNIVIHDHNDFRNEILLQLIMTGY